MVFGIRLGIEFEVGNHSPFEFWAIFHCLLVSRAAVVSSESVLVSDASVSLEECGTHSPVSSTCAAAVPGCGLALSASKDKSPLSTSQSMPLYFCYNSFNFQVLFFFWAFLNSIVFLFHDCGVLSDFPVNMNDFFFLFKLWSFPYWLYFVQIAFFFFLFVCLGVCNHVETFLSAQQFPFAPISDWGHTAVGSSEPRHPGLLFGGTPV